jgi:hypothetical protein
MLIISAMTLFQTRSHSEVTCVKASIYEWGRGGSVHNATHSKTQFNFAVIYYLKIGSLYPKRTSKAYGNKDYIHSYIYVAYIHTHMCTYVYMCVCIYIISLVWWLTPVIPSTQEAEIGKITV